MRRERVDLVQGQRRIEGLGERDLIDIGANVRGVAGLDGEDRPGGSEIALLHDAGRGAQVGRYANAFEDGSSGEEGLDISVPKVVRAGLNGSSTGTWNLR